MTLLKSPRPNGTSSPMTNKNARDKALNNYLKNACPYTRREIIGLVEGGVVKVVWLRGVLSLHPANDDAAVLLADLVRRGKTPPPKPVKRTDFALNPMNHDIPNLDVGQILRSGLDNPQRTV